MTARSCTTLGALLALFVGLGGPPAAGQGEARPGRIVSLNMCTDELLLRLVEPSRIASVTWLSQDSRGANMAAEASLVPANHGLAEEVLAARPDLVLAGRYTTRTTVSLLKRAGLRVVEFDVPTSLAEVLAQVRNVAAVVGEAQHGEALAGDMERRLAALDPQPQAGRPRAFVLRPNGVMASRGSLVDDVLDRAGIVNLASRLDLGAYGQVPLERVVLERADLLVVDEGRGGPPSLATTVLDHPALRALRGRLANVEIPSRLWTCAGPGVVEAVERLRAAARGLSRRPD